MVSCQNFDLVFKALFLFDIFRYVTNPENAAQGNKGDHIIRQGPNFNHFM